MLRKSRVRAQGVLRYEEPRFVPWVYALMRLSSPVYDRLAEGIAGFQTHGVERLIAAYQRFYRREARLLIAFRHAARHDPPVMVQLLCRILPREARRRRQALGGLPHAHFLYGRGVTLWAGGGAAFLIPRIAGLPVVNRRADTRALRNIRHFLTEGPHPVALAPEGQVTYHNHRLGPMEQGSARLAVWCQEELDRQGRAEEVLVLPVGIEYRFPRDPERLLERLIARITRSGGLTAPPPGPARERLLDLTEQLVGRIETYYARFFAGVRGAGGASPGATPGLLPGATPGLLPGASPGLRERIERACDAALRVPERFMGLQTEGDLLSRVFTVRQRGWDYLFRGDVPPQGRASPVDRLLADRLADEAYLHLRHNELVDVLEYVQPDYIGPGASPNRLVEYALNLADVQNRLLGGDISSRYSPPGKRVLIRIGEPLEVRRLCADIAAHAGGGVGAHARTAVVFEALSASLEALSLEEPSVEEPSSRP